MVKVQQLKLNAFRGVPGELQLDFSSPLTLVYAPNGTGKTSIVDGAEWLLTGEVARLDAFSKKGDIDELRCKFAPSGERMLVEGSFLRMGESFRLIRTPDEWLLYRNGESTPSRATRPAVMELLAPEEVGKETDYRTAPKLRSDWIRSARFLTESTLAVLVDADSQNQSARETALADFLGVSELSARSDKFERFAKYLNDGYAGAEGLAALKKELNRRNEELSQLREVSSVDFDSSHDLNKLLHSELLASAQCIKVDEGFNKQLESNTIPVEKAIGELNAKLAASSQRITEKKRLIDKLIQYWPEIDNRDILVTNAKKAQETSLESISSLTKYIDEGTQNVAKLDAAIAADTAKLCDLTEKKELLSKAVCEVLDSWGQIVKFADVQTLDQLPESHWNEKKINHIRGALDGIIEQLEAYRRDVSELTIAEEKLREMKATLPSEEQIEGIKRDLEETSRMRSLAKERYDAAAGPLEHLRLATERVVSHFKEQSDCPVCGHDWHSSKGLNDAILVTMASASKMVKGFGAEVLDLEIKDKELRGKLEQLNVDRRAINDIVARIKPLESNIRNFKDKLSMLSGHVNEELVFVEGSILNERLNQIKHRFNLAHSVANLRKLVDLTHSLDDVWNWMEIPIGQLQHKLEIFIAVMASDIKLRIDQIKESKHKLLQDLEKWRLSKVGEQAKLESSYRVLSENIPLLEEIQGAWLSLCGERARSEQVLAEVKGSILKQEESVSTAKSHLQAAERVEYVIARHRREADLEAGIKEIEQRVRRVESKRTQALEAAKLYREKANRYCAEQLDRLFEVAFPIFSRVQANELFDSIHRGPIENPFDWIAVSLAHTMRPSPHFSMGQRQDLALAIFIARARGLSGTFFLDEPIIHLDDLNRVALLDMFRMLAVENGSKSNFVITTASKSLVRHMAEKFGNVSSINKVPPLRIYELDGNSRFGVKVIRNLPIGAN